jgi:Protein of unknown function (DUF1566)
MSKPMLTIATLLMPVALAALTVRAALAAPADVPVTGQTLCYDSAGAEIDCATPGMGQDGDFPAGAAWPNPRFVVNDCGTPTSVFAHVVTDRLTGLMWRRAVGVVPVIWTTAITAMNGVTVCGFSDWRLPNVNELKSLMNFGVPSPAAWLSAQGFVNVPLAIFWTSTTDTGSPEQAFNVGLDSPGGVFTSLKSNTYLVWPVRAGQ